MRRTIAVLWILVFAGVAVAGGDAIAWHEGDVESAFDRAAREDKPLFLYWGAVWCPPCNQIKKTIFTKREFIEKTRLFVPVYLDGDTESAQAWGEKLKVWGYPTMLVLSPDGREVMRLPTGLQLEAFNQVLDEAMGRMTPIAEVLDSVLSATSQADVPDRSYRLLAYYSWGQDQQLELEGREREARLRALAERVPKRLAAERSRLYLAWLEAASSLAGETQDDDGVEAYRLPAGRRREADRRLKRILASRDLILTNLEFLTNAPSDVIPLLHPRPGASRERLADRWLEAMRLVEADPSLSVDERLSALLPEIAIHELRNGEEAPVGRELEERLRARVRWTDETATDTYTRQAALSTAGYLLRRAGLTDEARSLYLAEIEKSESPYYFMSSLAGLAEEAGDTEGAVSWLARAYESAPGRATRFQWGTRYLLGLMELVPDDEARIRTESLRVFKELLAFDDAFAGRNHGRILRLKTKYGEWNADDMRADEVATLRTALLPECDGQISEPVEGNASLRARCTTFFEELGRAEP